MFCAVFRHIIQMYNVCTYKLYIIFQSNKYVISRILWFETVAYTMYDMRCRTRKSAVTPQEAVSSGHFTFILRFVA